MCAGRIERETPEGKVSLASVVCVWVGVLVWGWPPWRVRREALMSSMFKRGRKRGEREGGVCDGVDEKEEEQEEGKIVPTEKRARVNPLLFVCVWAWLCPPSSCLCSSKSDLA
jgi:hypothetical protein